MIYIQKMQVHNQNKIVYKSIYFYVFLYICMFSYIFPYISQGMSPADEVVEKEHAFLEHGQRMTPREHLASEGRLDERARGRANARALRPVVALYLYIIYMAVSRLFRYRKIPKDILHTKFLKGLLKRHSKSASKGVLLA